MMFDKEQVNELADELVMLWLECSIKCDKINNLIKQIIESIK